MHTGCLFWGNKFCEHRNFRFELLHKCAHININNKDSYLQSDANMGLLKYLKDKAIILHCLEQAKNMREDLQHIFNAAQPPLPNSKFCGFPWWELDGEKQESDRQNHQGQKLLHVENLIWFIIFPTILYTLKKP